MVLAAGLAVAVAANAVSPRGLSLSRDYFPKAPSTGTTSFPPSGSVTGNVSHPVLGMVPTNTGATAAVAVAAAPVAAADASQEAVVRRLAGHGLRAVERGEVKALHDNPAYAQEGIVFVDARDDHHYAEGHIPAALSFDRFYPEKYLPVILPACMSAGQVVVYCTGGSCEDSEFAAVALKEAGVPA